MCGPRLDEHDCLAWQGQNAALSPAEARILVALLSVFRGLEVETVPKRGFRLNVCSEAGDATGPQRTNRLSA